MLVYLKCTSGFVLAVSIGPSPMCINKGFKGMVPIVSTGITPLLHDKAPAKMYKVKNHRCK